MENFTWKISLTLSLLLAAAGLALFIFSTKGLSSTLKQLSDSRLKKMMNFISKNNFVAMIIGVLITTMIQSSDGAVALIMGLLAGSLINLRTAIAFLLGANIGTATTSLIVAFESKFSFTEYFIFLIFIGVFGMLLTKKMKWQNLFSLLFSIGLIFFSLKILSGQAKLLIKLPIFQQVVGVMSANAWSSFIISFLFTGVLQSSSATVSLYQVMYEASQTATDNQGIQMSLSAALALVFGANVGTTITGLIVSFSTRNKESKKIAVIWGITNFSISFVLLFFLSPLTWYADLIKMIVPNSPRFQLSIGHLLFNFILVAIYIWLTKYLEKLVNLIIKDKKKKSKFDYEIILPNELIDVNHTLALQSAKKAIKTQTIILKEGTEIISKFLKTGDKKILNRLYKLEAFVDNTRGEIYNYLIKINSKKLNKEDSEIYLSLILSARSIEKIMKLGVGAVKELNKIHNSKNEKFFDMDSESIHEVNELLSLLRLIAEKTIKQISNFNAKERKTIQKLTDNLDILSHEFLKLNILRLANSNSHTKQLEVGFEFDFVIRSLERMGHHFLRVNNYHTESKRSLIALNKKEDKEFKKVHGN
ncbi:Na/Pi cotransporter family protein [Mesomycoplasma neurolyticum]|uniref:Na/Pi-cotransporter II-related protein n=1 Tax=Mesomycoplasma neurolyticum TaxID=2120 RepID=A0A449A4H1_9BACT|nr:Na/Pi symporter [Mesomycoplasma neurolyticum]VEU59180.1 Na/Pi-cotransporter II-related protein [Mesomycoplasma neurolyticum]